MLKRWCSWWKGQTFAVQFTMAMGFCLVQSSIILSVQFAWLEGQVVEATVLELGVTEMGYVLLYDVSMGRKGKRVNCTVSDNSKTGDLFSLGDVVSITVTEGRIDGVATCTAVH